MIIGAVPLCTMKHMTITNNSIESRTTTTTVDGTGTAAGDMLVTNPRTSENPATTAFEYELALLHDLGVYFDFTPAVHLSADVSIAVAGGGIDINLVIQGIIKLPAPGAE